MENTTSCNNLGNNVMSHWNVFLDFFDPKKQVSVSHFLSKIHVIELSVGSSDDSLILTFELFLDTLLVWVNFLLNIHHVDRWVH